MTRRRALTYWLCQLAGWSSWSVVGLLYSLAYAAPGAPAVPAWKYVLIYGSGMVVPIGWTHLYRHQLRRRGWAAFGPGRLLPRVIPVSLFLGVAIAYTLLPIAFVVGPGRIDVLGVRMIPGIMGESWCVFMWNVAYFGVHYFERWRQAEVDKLQLAVVAAEAKLHGLMSQLNPHFLFNCLNSVRGLIVEDPAKAQAAVTELSDLMRYSMQASRIATVPLATEIEMVETYLSLEAVRLDERLTSALDIAAETRRVLIPTMLVQSLVENAVKHGIEHLPAGGTIGVASWLDAGTLRVRVTNSGQIVLRNGSTRVGLANARERLRLLYDGRASLVLRDDGGAVVADLSVPVVLAVGAEEA